MINAKIIAVVDTKIKLSTMDSTALPETDFFDLKKGKILEINWYKPADNNHWEFELDVPVNGLYNWLAYEPHIRIEDPDVADGQKILDAVKKVNAEQPYYQKRDITGDGIAETFCNWFAGDVLDQLDVPVPRYGPSAGNYVKPHPIYENNTPNKPKSATDLFNELSRGGDDGKWKTVSKAVAISSAKNGKPTVACCPRPTRRGQGHIAIVLPKGSFSDMRIAQAGSRNSNDMRFETGFGSKASSAKFFVYG